MGTAEIAAPQLFTGDLVNGRLGYTPPVLIKAIKAGELIEVTKDG